VSRNEEFAAGQGFRYSVEHNTAIEGHAVVSAQHPDGREVGFMELGPDSGRGRRVMDVQVHAEHRRKGVATGLWNHAKEQGLDPVHSSERTKAGDRWAQSVGDYYPPREIV